MQAAVAGLAQQRVVRPERLIRMLAPGFDRLALEVALRIAAIRLRLIDPNAVAGRF